MVTAKQMALFCNLPLEAVYALVESGRLKTVRHKGRARIPIQAIRDVFNRPAEDT